MLYSPLQNTGIYSNVLSTTDNNDCSVSTFIHINSDVQLQWTSFATDCLNIRISKLLLVDVTSVVTIPNAFLDSSEILLSVYSHNDLDNVVALGKFITMSNDRKNTYMTLDVKTSGEVNGILHGANASLFDANIIADVVFGNKLAFEAHCTIFGHYSGVLSVSAEFTTSWDTLALHVEGVLDSGNGSFQNALQSRIISYIDYLANFTKQRIAKAKRNIEKSESKLNILQTEIEALEEEYETKLTKYNESLADLGYWHDIQKEAENNLDAALKAYNISDSKKEGINELCDIQECQKICISGAKQYTCYKPMYITIDGTCNNFQPVSILTQHSQAKLVEYCEWVNSCKKKLGVKWIGPVDVGLPIPIPIPIPWIKKKCYKVCDRRQRYEMTFIDAYETVIQKVAFNCPVEAYNGSSPYTCFKFYDCVKKEDEEPCATMNNECEDMKTQALINATDATAESLQKLTAVYEDYASASSNVKMAQTNVEVIELELNLIEQEINITKEAHNSANFAYNLSLESYESIILDLTDELLITNWLDNHTSAYNLIALDSIEFSQEFTTQTPTVFPLSITYDIPYSGMTFQTTVVIDFNSPLDFVKDTIAGVVVQHAINSVFGPYKSKRAIGKSESLKIAKKFESNCLLLERSANYLLHLNNSLNNLLNDTIQSNDYVKDFIKSVEDDVNSVLSASSNVSDKYFKSLQEQKLHYLNATNASYSNLVQTINKHAFQQWQRIMDDYHNATQSIPGETCFSFSDCLHAFIDIVFILLIDIPDPNDHRDYLLLKLPLADAELESLALETDLSFSNAIQKIHLAKDLIDSVYKLDYWCASAPNITVHPPAEVNIQHDETLSLYCLAESCLPVSYRWTKDGAIIPGSTSSELVLKKFRASDEGVYVCEAINDVQVAESIPSVVIYYQVPFFNVTPRSYTTYIGDESGVEFICDAIATPAPLWAWYFRESDNDTWEELDFETSNILYFEKPMYQNEGWYKCKVWNEFGNVSSDPVKLTLLPATIALNGYPISVTIEETLDTSYIDDFSSSDTDLDIAISIKNSLESLLALKTTIIETVKVLPLDPNKYRIEFLLITPNATKATTIMSLESIIDNITQYVQDLEEAKNAALYILSDQDKTVMFYHQDYSYAIVNNSVSIQHQVFLCPEGQALHPNYFFCGKLLSLNIMYQ